MNARCTWLLASALLLATALPSAPAWACKCAVQTVEQAKTQADAIFEGRVTGIEDVPSAHDPSRLEKRVTFGIVRVWKDLENAETISVITSASTASCGYPFEAGTSYLVYAGRTDQGYGVTTCSRTRPLGDASEDLAALGGGVTPVHIQPTEPKPAAPAAPPPAPAAPPPAKSGGCASKSASGAPQSAALLWLGAPLLGLAVRRRRG